MAGLVLFGATFDMAIGEDGLDAGTRMGVDDLEAIEGKHAVFAHDGDNVGGDAHGHQVEIFEHAQLEVLAFLLTDLVELVGIVA